MSSMAGSTTMTARHRWASWDGTRLRRLLALDITASTITCRLWDNAGGFGRHLTYQPIARVGGKKVHAVCNVVDNKTRAKLDRASLPLFHVPLMNGRVITWGKFVTNPVSELSTFRSHTDVRNLHLWNMPDESCSFQFRISFLSSAAAASAVRAPNSTTVEWMGYRLHIFGGPTSPQKSDCALAFTI